MAEGNKYTKECKGPQIELLNKEVELRLSALGLKNGIDPESPLFLAQEKNYKSFVTAKDNSIMIAGMWRSGLLPSNISFSQSCQKLEAPEPTL